jgi:mRNA-degrading endonuclease RelE of RelBE toxin-antitoxin system
MNTLPEEKNSAQSKNSSPNCNIHYLDDFKREAKWLKKKYASLKGEIGVLAEELRTNPTKGTPIGRSCYKIRLAVESKGKGKSGGARVITCYHVHGETVYLLSIYDKGKQDNISEERIAELLSGIKITD